MNQKCGRCRQLVGLSDIEDSVEMWSRSGKEEREERNQIHQAATVKVGNDGAVKVAMMELKVVMMELLRWQ